MITIESDEHPNQIKNSDFYRGKIRDEFERKLLDAVQKDTNVKISVTSAKGNKTPTEYQAKLIRDNPKSIDDFIFQEVNV